MITVNLYYKGKNGAARAFAEEMTASGTVAAIRAEDGNLRYEYFFPMDDPETVLLIDSWQDQESIDVHHASPMMKTIAALREKYDLHMEVERFVSEDLGADEQFIRKWEHKRSEGDTCIEIIDTPDGDDAGNKLLSIGFDCGDADKMREKLIALGMDVSPIESPVPYVRFFFVKDPAGVTVQFM